MSDEFLPPSGPRADDESPWREPDENGLGHYAVEEYSGRPNESVPNAADPPPGPPRAQPQLPPGPVQPAPLHPVSSSCDRAESEPDWLDVDLQGWDAGNSDTDDSASYSQRLTRAGRVPFADRNWRVPLIVTLVVAMVVLGAVALLLPDGGADNNEADSGIVELRQQPVKQWDEDLDGFSAAVTADDSSTYILVAKKSGTELVAFDLATGSQRWSTEIGLSGSAAIGDVSVVDAGLAVVFSRSRAEDGMFAIVDPENGKIKWKVDVTSPVSTIESTSIISGLDTAGEFELFAVDYSKKTVGAAVRTEGFVIVDDFVYLDDPEFDGNGVATGRRVLTRVDKATLTTSDEFAYRHDNEIIGAVGVDGDLVVGSGEQIVRVDDGPTPKYSFDPQVGIIRKVIPMSGSQVLVSGANRMCVVALNDTEAEASSQIRVGASPLVVHEVEGDDLIIAFDGVDEGVAPAMLRTLRLDGDKFEQVSETDLVSSEGAPPVEITGVTGYTRTYTMTGSTIRPTGSLFFAFDLKTGERLWSIALLADDETTMTRTGVIVMTRESDESIASFYSNND